MSPTCNGNEGRSSPNAPSKSALERQDSWVPTAEVVFPSNRNLFCGSDDDNRRTLSISADVTNALKSAPVHPSHLSEAAKFNNHSNSL